LDTAAADATVAADRLSQEFKVQGLYTYGSPRVGNDVFVNRFPIPNAYRFVHHRDVITMVPTDQVLAEPKYAELLAETAP
jgi:predicted lipase